MLQEKMGNQSSNCCMLPVATFLHVLLSETDLEHPNGWLMWLSLKDCFQKVHVMSPTMTYNLHVRFGMFMVERVYRIAASDYSPSYLVTTKKKILVRKTALRLPKADLKLSWIRGSLKDDNNSQDATWIKENKLPQNTFPPNLISTNVHFVCSDHLSYKIFYFIANHLVVPRVPWKLYLLDVTCS